MYLSHATQSPRDSEVYSVYSAAIDTLCISQGKVKRIFVADSTLPNRGFGRIEFRDSMKVLVVHDLGIGKYAPEVRNEAFKRMWPGIDTVHLHVSIAKFDSRGLPLILDSLRCRLPAQRWSRDSSCSAILKSDSAAVLFFSRPIFNDSRTDALIYLEYACGPGCGSGQWCWLKKSLGTWKLFSLHRLWRAS